ncbi:MAG: hypothetical protein Q4A76_05630, partial [Porphyromonadaceae bacterium]|nr:hypothetical protein [Porphyromonadaceae bacterium]
VDYNKTPTKEDCLARPVINETFIGGRTENGVFATIQGCLYRAQGVVTCDPDNMERCAADWTPVDIAPCVGEDCTDTEENGGSSGGSGGSGNGSGGSSGGSGGSGNGSNGGSGEGSVGGDSFILSRILGVVIDISNKLSFSAIDVDKSLQSYDSQLDSVISGETQNAFDPSSFDGVLKDAFSSIPDTWLKIDFDRLLYSGFNSSQPLIFKIELNFTSIWPSLGVKTIIIDTTSYTSLYDSIIRPIIEYSLYLLTALACYFIVRRAILMNSNI